MFGNALAHSTSQRFPDTDASIVESPGPGTYKTSFNLISKKIGDRWDMESSAFRSGGSNRKRLGRLGRHLMASSSSSPSLSLTPTVLKSSPAKMRRARPLLQPARTKGSVKKKDRVDVEGPVAILDETGITKSGWENSHGVKGGN